MLCSLAVCSSCMEQSDIIDKRFTTIQDKCVTRTIRMDAKDLNSFSSDNGTYHCTAEIYKETENSGQDSIWLIERSGKLYEGRFIDAYWKVRKKHMMITAVICMAMIALILSMMYIMIIRRRLIMEKHENSRLRKEFDDLMLERDALSKADTRNSESRKIINERLRIIDQFVISEALNDQIFEEMASQRLSELINDRKEFIRQTRLIFNSSYPDFIKYLTERGINEKEMEICCLYAIGLNGKMVTSFTNLKRHYHIGCEIRKKLGMNGHSTNLSIYIRHLLEELEYNGN